MFASKSWYKEVVILGIVPRAAGVAIAFVLWSLLNNSPSILANIPSFLMFVGLAVWRVKVKALNVKEVLVLYFVPIPLEIGVSLLVPFYLAIPIATGLLFLIVGQLHVREVKKLDQKPDESLR
jgi:hypothetical protein